MYMNFYLKIKKYDVFVVPGLVLDRVSYPE